MPKDLSNRLSTCIGLFFLSIVMFALAAIVFFDKNCSMSAYGIMELLCRAVGEKIEAASFVILGLYSVALLIRVEFFDYSFSFSSYKNKKQKINPWFVGLSTTLVIASIIILESEYPSPLFKAIMDTFFR